MLDHQHETMVLLGCIYEIIYVISVELISIMLQPRQCHWNGPYVSYDSLNDLSDVLRRIIQYIYSSQTLSYY